MNPASMAMGQQALGQMQMGMNPMMMGMPDGMGMMGMPGMGMAGMAMPGMMAGGMMPGAMQQGGGMGGGGGQQMGAAGGGGGGGGGDIGPDSRFYKTKICHRFMEGKCNYGPGCKYAHGEADLRSPGGGGPAGGGGGGGGPRSGKIMTPHGSAAVGGMGMAGAGMGGGMGGMGMGGAMPGMQGMAMGGAAGGMGGGMGGMAMGGMGQQLKPAMGQGGQQGDKGASWRTRLCEQFMTQGSCRYGTNCTFAHGQHELRNGGGGGGGQRMGGGPRNNQQQMGGGGMGGMGMGGQKRPMDMQPGGGAAGDGLKRARMEPVQPPEHEALPVEGTSLDVETIKQHFEALQQEANRFARDTGHSVALFTIGGVFSDAEDSADLGQLDYLADAKAKDGSAVAPRLKVAVLKYGTGGVAKQLVTRGEIVKFVSARGAKALGEMHAVAHAEGDASA